MTDKELYELCKQYGKQARKWKNKFVALLPEVYKRKLYRKKNFHSIYEFAYKVGGLSRNVVDEAIRVDEKLHDKPKLKALIPEVGLSKVKTVATVATAETDEFWADKVQNMNRNSLETYMKDVKKFPGESSEKNANLSLFDDENQGSEMEKSSTQNNDKSTFSIQLSEKTIFQLKLLKQKLEKETKNVLCWDEVIKLASEKLLTPEPKRKYKQRPLKSRPVPAAKRRKQPKKCIVPECNEPAEIIHHPDRYSITKNHDNLASMCKAHHELAHRGYIDERNDFKTLVQPIIDPIKQFVDQKMLGYLRGT